MKPTRSLHRRSFLRQTAGAIGAGMAAEMALAAVEPAFREPAKDEPLFPFRECYCPAHFGNSYEAMWPRELTAYLADMKAMGFNRFGDWMVTTDARDPYPADPTWHLAKEQLDRKKKAFRAAQDLGLDLNLILTPNHVYLDQLRPEYEAKKSPKIFGQLICPSHPEGRRIILHNFERWFDDLANAGLHFSAFTGFAYDYGGCDCEKCRPWILTYARLMKTVHEIARKRHPDIEPWLCSWWWAPEEHAQFNDWAAQEAPGWLKAMTMHIEYGQTCPKDVPVPAGCRKLAFVHIGYGDQRDVEVYGRQGAVVAPNRLSETVRQLHALGFEGFQAYSEGVFDDVNKAILAGLGSGQFADSDSVLRAYAERYLGASPDDSAQWSAWIARWGDHKKVPLPDVATEFDRLALRAKPGWRLEHWRIKLELEELDRAIGSPKPAEWSAEKLALADKWFAAQERLYRDVYRLGPVRHVLNPRFMPPAWFASWSQATATTTKPGVVLPQQ